MVGGSAAWEQAGVARDTRYSRDVPADPVGSARRLLARLDRA